MRNRICTFLLPALILYCSASHAQQQPNVGCIDKGLALFADDVKKGFEKQGMSVYRDAMVGMDPETAYPIEVKLEKGHIYQLLFIGNQNAAKAGLELFDGDDKRIGAKDIKRGASPNYIVYGFTPLTTDTYLIMLSQRAKGNPVCGSFTILEQGGNNTDKPKTATPANTPTNNSNNQKSNSNRYIGPSGNTGNH